MPSLGLSIISATKKDAKRIIDKYSKYFDEVYLELAPNCRDFAEARNRGLKKIKTDYWLWLDTDDDIINPEKIRDLVKWMDEQKLDAIYMPYHYGYNDQKELIALHWRERLIRTAHPFKWVGKVHETLISTEFPNRVKNDEVYIKHLFKTEADTMKSVLRNHEILEANKDDGDARTLYYLGRSYFILKDYMKSASTLLEYTRVSGWDEQRYDAWSKIADCMILLDEHDKAINACLEAIKITPAWPDAYFKIGDIYLALDQPQRAISWLKNGLNKPPPQTLEIIDPTLYTYRPLVSLALAHFTLAKIDLAYKFITEASKFKPKSPIYENAFETVSRAYLEEKMIKSASLLGKFVEKKGNLKKYLQGLPAFVKNDLRLRELRVKAFPPKKWNDKSIVIYCGETWNEWGPDTLHEGMGGSEEAVVYLSREFAKLGYEVTVYNQRVEEYYDDINGGISEKTGEYNGVFKSVHYKPWETFNPEDEFNIFIAWRNPSMPAVLKLKANFIGIDMHDAPGGHQQITQNAVNAADKFFFKSNYQRSVAPQVPDEKAVVISNGIVKEQFKPVKKKPFSVIYASSYDRGLGEVLLDMWPKIRKQVPEATLDIYYGWNSYDAFHKGDSGQMKWKWDVIRKLHLLKDQGVTEHGRVSHEKLAEAFGEAKVWAYPTEFNEINCITALKAQEAGCIPVTTYNYALKEAVVNPEFSFEVEDIYSNPEAQKRFIDNMVKALKSDMKVKKVPGVYWKQIALKWKEAYESQNPRSSQ